MPRRSRILRVSKFDSTVGRSAVTHGHESNTSLQRPSRRVSRQILKGFNKFSF